MSTDKHGSNQSGFIRGCPWFSFGFFLIVALATTGCVHSRYAGRIMFPSATINGVALPIALDSGAGMNWVYAHEAARLQLKSTVTLERNSTTDTSCALSEPVRLESSDQSCNAPIAVFGMDWKVRLGMWFTSGDMMGAVGWPAIRDNLLEFDSERQIVRRLDRLPEDLSGWTQAKVRRAQVLTLEIPAADGKLQVFVVDTGAPSGVSLSPSSWEAWRKNYPEARVRSTLSFYLGRTDMMFTKVADGETVDLGVVRLHQVPVGLQPSYERKLFPDATGLIGLFGLERMALVVDAKNGVAYLKPRPPTDAQQKNLHWIVGENVRLNVTPQLAFAAELRGMFKYSRDDHTGAIADLSEAITHDPNNGVYFLERAVARQRSGDGDGAIADATQSLALRPNHAGAHLLRGTVYMGKHQLDPALADFNRAIELDAGNSSAFLFRCMVKLGKLDFVGATNDANRAIELDLSNGLLFAMRGMAQYLNGNLDAGVADLDRAVKLDPKNKELVELRKRAAAHEPMPAGEMKFSGTVSDQSLKK